MRIGRSTGMERGRERKERKGDTGKKGGDDISQIRGKMEKEGGGKKEKEKKGDFFRDFSFLPVSKETSSLLDFPFEEKSLEESSANGGNFLCESAVRPIWVGLPVAVTPLPAR